MKHVLIIFLLGFSACTTVPPGTTPQKPIEVSKDTSAFVSLTDIDPSILVEMRYASEHNFLGRKVQGYGVAKCLLTREAAIALSQAQTEVKPYGLTFKVYDCYRPQKAVEDFMAWAKQADDTKMKAEFYPHVMKAEIIPKGYVAEKSGHSRGSTVDLTLVNDPPPVQPPFTGTLVSCKEKAGVRFADNSLDMGTGYDCFDPLASTSSPLAGPVALRNRLLLKSILEKYGFVNYSAEWWHYTLKNEPFPNTYFDFPIE